MPPARHWGRTTPSNERVSEHPLNPLSASIAQRITVRGAAWLEVPSFGCQWSMLGFQSGNGRLACSVVDVAQPDSIAPTINIPMHLTLIFFPAFTGVIGPHHVRHLPLHNLYKQAITSPTGNH
jgi:hypothetical protein